MISELRGMLGGLLQPDPCLRMTLDELLLQSWVSQPISLAEYSWAEVVCAAQNYCKLTNQLVFLTVKLLSHLVKTLFFSQAHHGYRNLVLKYIPKKVYSQHNMMRYILRMKKMMRTTGCQ